MKKELELQQNQYLTDFIGLLRPWPLVPYYWMRFNAQYFLWYSNGSLLSPF